MTTMLAELRDHNNAGVYWNTSQQVCNNDHPLAFIDNYDDVMCNACGKLVGELTFCCTACDFDLCVECATHSERSPVEVVVPVTFTDIAKKEHGVLLHKGLYMECGRVMAKKMVQMGQTLRHGIHPHLPGNVSTYIYGEEDKPMMREVVREVLESRGLSLGWQQ